MSHAKNDRGWRLLIAAIALVIVGCAVGINRPRNPIQPNIVTVGVPVAAAPAARVIATVGGPRLTHAAHMERGLECEDCHEMDEDTGAMGYPDRDGCMDCHEDIEEDEEVPPEKSVGVLYFNEDGSPRWQTAIQEYDGDVLFSHAAHAGKAECTDCHDNLEVTPRRKELLYTMNQCSACHVKSAAPNECATCHEKIRAEVAPASHLAAGWEARHGPRYTALKRSGEENTCAYCHTQQSFCTDCHQSRQPSSHRMPGFGETGHGQQVLLAQSRGQTTNCTLCHQNAEFCNNCHQNRLPLSHQQGNFEQAHGQMVWQAGGPQEARCTFCHREPAYCDGCHQSRLPSSHKRMWTRRHGIMAKAGDMSGGARCAFCHDDPSFCEDCHRDQEPRDHTALFRTRTHGVVASIDRTRCTVCHQPDFCIRCHQETEPRSHRGMWARGRNTHCIACHIPVSSEPRCYTCHKQAPHDTAPPLPPGHNPASNCRLCHNQVGGGGAPPLRHFDNGQACQLCHN